MCCCCGCWQGMGLSPRSRSFGPLIAVFAKAGDCDRVLQYYEEMKAAKLARTAADFVNAVRCLTGAGRHEDADRVLAEMSETVPTLSMAEATEMQAVLQQRPHWKAKLSSVDSSCVPGPAARVTVACGDSWFGGRAGVTSRRRATRCGRSS